MKKTTKIVAIAFVIIMSAIAILALSSCEEHVHEFGAWTVTKKATCTESGEQERLCSCGEKQTQTLAATGHTEAITAAVSPTCIATGLTEGSHCSVCGATIVSQAIIPKVAHTWNDGTITKETTCAEPGKKTYTCAVCNGTKIENIEKLAHTPVIDQSVEPTCSATGLTEGSHCSICGAKITSQTIIPKVAHTPVMDQSVEPTCSATGLTEGSHCSVCGATITSQTIIPKVAHTWNSGEITEAPTCTETGTKTYTCTVCGETKTENIEKLAHTPVTDQAIEPTCSVTGLTEGSHCSVCGATITSQKIVQKLAHTWDFGETTSEATCTAPGTKIYTCIVCGEKKTESIPVLGHNVDSTGKCTRCGLYFMNMTVSEEAAAEKVETMSHSVSEFSYSDEIRINISFKDSSSYDCQTPAYVDVKIVNSLGVTVYSKTLVKTSAQSYVSIKTSDITEGYSGTGILYYTVYNTGYFSFSQINRELTTLPWTVDVILPDLPKAISDSYSICKVTSITYEVKNGDYLYIYFAGEKTYDTKGSNYSRSCKVGWKLYDSEGYVVKSGTLYTEGICVGEKFRNEYVAIYNITPSETYRLEIMNVG